MGGVSEVDLEFFAATEGLEQVEGIDEEAAVLLGGCGKDLCRPAAAGVGEGIRAGEGAEKEDTFERKLVQAGEYRVEGIGQGGRIEDSGSLAKSAKQSGEE